MRYMTVLAIVATALALSSSGEAVGIPFASTDVLSIAFSMSPDPRFGDGPIDSAMLILSRTDINLGTPPTPVPAELTILSASLFDDGVLLGVDSRPPLVDTTPGGGSSYQFLWTSPDSDLTVARGLPASVIDFSTLADGTTNGLILISILSGDLIAFSPDIHHLIFGEGGPNSITLRSVTDISQVLLNGADLPPIPPVHPVPAPPAIALVMAGALAALPACRRAPYSRNTLMSYGASTHEMFKIMADQVAQSLDGARPGEVSLIQIESKVVFRSAYPTVPNCRAKR